jgi:amphi-Trp domain-containing protein
MKKNEVKVKGTMDVKAVAAILEDMVRSFKEGTVCIESGKEFVTLKPAGNIDLEVEAAEKKGKQKLVIEMGWREPVPEPEAEETVFKISSKEPEIEETASIEDKSKDG